MKNFSLAPLILTAFLASGVLTPAKARAAADDLYVVAPFQNTIYKYTPGGTKTTFTTGLQSTPNYLAFDKAGNLYVNEGSGAAAKISKFTAAGVKTTFATGIEATGLRCDNAGNLFVSDFLTHSIIKITPAGAKSTFAPNVNTLDLAFDGAGNLYAADFGAPADNPGGSGIDGQGKIYKFTPDGTKTTFRQGLNRPKQLAVDYGTPRLFIANTDGVVRTAYLGSGLVFDVEINTGLGNIQGLACNGNAQLFISGQTGIVKYPFDLSGPSPSNFATINDPSGLACEPPRGNSLNIATRLGVQTGDNALIAGFIITGPEYKTVLVRGMGPSLTKAGVAGALQDPTIEMHFPNGIVQSNDNWKEGQAAQYIQGTAFAPGDDRESALEFNIPPGNYTVIERGKSNTTGVGLVEVYDLDTANSRLANISTRGFVGAADSVMIGGFILGANGARVIVRAIGPSLANAGVTGALSNPTLSLRNANGVEIAANDNWRDTQQREIRDAGVAPADDLESAISTTLPNGNFTAVMQGVNGATGIGLIEVYNLQ